MAKPQSRRSQAPSKQPHQAILPCVAPDPREPRAIAREFKERIRSGAQLLPAGEAKEDPEILLTPKYLPRFAVHVFDATFYLTDQRFDDDVGFFVGYVGLHEKSGRTAEKVIKRLYPRIFYKDSSLVWRVATHVIHTDDENWLGKGDVKWFRSAGIEHLSSAEETTNLPYEIQPAFDEVSRANGGKRKRDDNAIFLVLRRAPSDRIEPYVDFSGPRAKAMAIFSFNGGRDVASFTRKLDPASLRFARGYEPDFARGLIDVAGSGSRLYGGAVEKYRFLSRNRRIQWQFIASKTHVWINPPQALTTELLTYGTRNVDVNCDEDVFVPGYEYHFLDEEVDPPEVHTQIPEGYAGAPSAIDPHRADASRWIDALPVVREFRRKILKSH